MQRVGTAVRPERVLAVSEPELDLGSSSSWPTQIRDFDVPTANATWASPKSGVQDENTRKHFAQLQLSDFNQCSQRFLRCEFIARKWLLRLSLNVLVFILTFLAFIIVKKKRLCRQTEPDRHNIRHRPRTVVWLNFFVWFDRIRSGSQLFVFRAGLHISRRSGTIIFS